MIFTRDFVTRENYWQIASLVTQKSLFTVTHALFFISLQWLCNLNSNFLKKKLLGFELSMVKLCQLSTKLGLLSCWFASLFARDHIPLRGRVQPSVTNDQVEARHQIWQTFEIWWCRMLTKQPCPLEEPGVSAGQVHTHPIAMKWRMGGGTYHPINKPYEITAALLETSHTSWKIRSSILS